MSKQKMTPDVIPQDFTLGLALVDVLPVLFFGGSAILGALLFHSLLFFLGALLCLFAGGAKVIWKIIVVLKQKNIWWLFLQMRILMPIGMLLMLIGAITGSADLQGFLAAAGRMPGLACFITGFAGMAAMIGYGFFLDSSDVRVNWLEQLTNALAQAAFFIGLLLTMKIM